MKIRKIGSLLLALVMAVSLAVPAAAAPITFPDVKTSDWFYSDVQKAVDTGLIDGYDDGTFGPNRNMTYAEAIKLAAAMYKMSTTGNPEFEEGKPWYQPYADYAKDVGIISKDYDWNQPATRAGYMEIFAKAIPDHPAMAGMKGLEAINTVPDGTIPDVPMTHPQAAAIYKLYRAGILQGNDDQHSCLPGSNIRRSEVAAILTRMMDPGERISFSMGEETSVEPLTITDQPKDFTVSEGANAVFVVQVTGGRPPYKYEWHYADSSGDAIAEEGEWFYGAETSILTSLACVMSEDGDRYYCVITDADGTEVVSKEATLTVTEAYSPMEISVQPDSVTVTEYSDATFIVAVSGGRAPYTYQWYCYDPNTDTVSPMIEDEYSVGVNTPTFTNKACSQSEDQHLFFCEISDAESNMVTSGRAELTVIAPVSTLTITTQPQSITVTEGTDASFAVAVSGGQAPYTYQWRESSPGGYTYGLFDGTENYSGTETAELTVHAPAVRVTESGAQYYCTVYDALGAEAVSAKATLTVTASTSPLMVIYQPGDVVVIEGGDVSFNVVVSGGTEPYQYQWHKIRPDGEDIIPTGKYYDGVNSSKLIAKNNVISADNGAKYYCVITDADKTTVISASAEVQVAAALHIASQSRPVKLSSVKNYTLTVTPAGGVAPYKYQWMVIPPGEDMTTDLSDGDKYSGTKTSNLTLKSFTEADSGSQYCCVVTDVAGGRVSSEFISVTLGGGRN